MYGIYAIYIPLFSQARRKRTEGREEDQMAIKEGREGRREGRRGGGRKNRGVLREEGRDGSTKEEQKGVLPLSPCVQGTGVAHCPPTHHHATTKCVHVLSLPFLLSLRPPSSLVLSLSLPPSPPSSIPPPRYSLTSA